jgi:hypothetical protein
MQVRRPHQPPPPRLAYKQHRKEGPGNPITDPPGAIPVLDAMAGRPETDEPERDRTWAVVLIPRRLGLEPSTRVSLLQQGSGILE